MGWVAGSKGWLAEEDSKRKTKERRKEGRRYLGERETAVGGARDYGRRKKQRSFENLAGRGGRRAVR